MMMIEEEKNETPDDKRPEQKEIAALEKWKQEEFGRWRDVFPEMKKEQIWKEVAILEKWRQERFDELKKEPPQRPNEEKWREERFDELKKKSPQRSNEEICKIVEDNVLAVGTTKRLRKLLIGEDIKKMSEQLDQVLERNEGALSGASAKRREIYKKRKNKFEAKIAAVDNSQPSASIEKNQYRILEKLEEMFLGSFNSSLEEKKQLRLLNHSSLKSQLPLIAVLREMKSQQKLTTDILESSEQVQAKTANILQGVEKQQKLTTDILEKVAGNTDRKQQIRLIIIGSFFGGALVLFLGKLLDWGLALFKVAMGSGG